MRASTANRVLIWTVVGIGGVAVLTLLTGDPVSRDLVRGFVFLVLLVGGITWVEHRFRVAPRRISFRRQAREAGLRAERGDPRGLLHAPFALFGRTASVREIENTATGSREGTEVIVADYWLAPTSSPEVDDYLRYTCVLTEAPAWWPDLSVMPETFPSRLRSTFGLPDIRTESEEFDRRFEVRSADRRFANAFLDARVMHWLLEQPPGVGFEVRDRRLMVFRPRATSSVDDLGETLALHDALGERIPRVVRAGPFP